MGYAAAIAFLLAVVIIIITLIQRGLFGGEKV
jgi:multiple sugar transport system permease protein